MLCKRYSGTRPSELLEIDNPINAFQVDTALALRGQHEDQEFIIKLMESLIERIEDNFDLLIKTWGGKVKRDRKKKSIQEYKVENAPQEEKTVSQVLKEWGGKGVKIERS